tara:strand:+ start:571 stop:921 length:351 start_codon:yes stop_codon:yes gene_type:complete
MSSVLFAIALFLNIGPKAHILKTFCEQDVRYIKQHIGNNVVLRVENQSVLFGKKRSIEWFERLAKDPRIIDTKIEKLKNNDQFTYVVYFKFTEQGTVFTHLIYIEVYKGRILRIVG